MLRAHTQMLRIESEVVRFLPRYGSLPVLELLANTRHAKQRYLFASAIVTGTALRYTAPERHRRVNVLLRMYNTKSGLSSKKKSQTQSTCADMHVRSL